jgi:hypothetical protein
MSLLDGLYAYEVVLLVLGVLFFLLLVVLMVMLVKGGKGYAAMLPFFAIPIAMIGYPGIKEIQFDNGVVSIENATQAVQANPSDPALLSDLRTKVASLGNRGAENPSVVRARSVLNGLGAVNSSKNPGGGPPAPPSTGTRRRSTRGRTGSSPH